MDCPITFIGIGVPGTVDHEGDTVICAPNLRWKDEPVADFFEKAYGERPLLIQDTRAAAWAEARTERMKNKRCIACVTLGTGIGCGLVIEGKIWKGSLGTAGEIGHIPVVQNGRACACGRKGCMEAYASGTGIAKTAREQNLCETAEEVFYLAYQGNFLAKSILEQAVNYAAMSMAALINVLSPDALLFSGGMAAQKELYITPLIKKIKELAYQNALHPSLYIGTALLGNNAPVIGAAFLDKEKEK